jgi:methyl-accepting chemotaxis protein
LTRVSAVYFTRSDGDQEWADFQASLEDTREHIAALLNATAGDNILYKSAQSMETFVNSFAEHADEYYSNVLAGREFDTRLTTAGRRLQGSADRDNQEYGYGGGTLISTLAKQEMDRNQQSAMTLIIAVIIAALVIGAALTILTTRGITRPISRINKGLKKISTGDLTEIIDINSRDEVGQMARSYSDMQTYLNNLVYQLKQNAVQLSGASEQLATAARQSSESTQQVSASSQQMARGAQEQSVNAQETAAAIKQLSEMINRLAGGAV